MPCLHQDASLWGASIEQLELLGWHPQAHGPQANCIPLAAVTTKSAGPSSVVSHSMPRLDGICRLASAMVKADTAARHVAEAWRVLQLPAGGSVCPHMGVNQFPKLPIYCDGAMLFNFPILEVCFSCGLVIAAYPGVPHPMRHIGYGKLTKK